MEFVFVKVLEIILLLQLCSGVSIRTKRVDKDNINPVPEGTLKVRTKRIEKTQDTLPIGESIDVIKPTMTNDINKLRSVLFGPCSGQKVNQTFRATGCEPVTMEVLVCGGICDTNVKPFNTLSEIGLTEEKCTFCGPAEYEEKLFFFQCNSGQTKRRRWKMEMRKIFTAKRCACLEDSCYKRNKVSNEHHELL